MATIAQTILNDARRVLQDESNVAERWKDATLLAGLIEAERAIVHLRHDAYTEALAFQSAGTTQNELPAGSVAVIDVRRNLGTAGTSPGRMIRRTALEWMDMADPDWHVAAPAEEAMQWMFDDRDARRFYLWPPVVGYVEVIHSVLPPVLEDDDPINLEDIYVPALRAYVVYYAFAQDTDNSTNDALATKWFEQFIFLVTGKKAAEESLQRGKHRAP